MQVTITRTLQLPEELTTINDLEEQILEFGRRLMREVMIEAWHLYQEAQWQCEVCGSSRISAEGYKPFGLYTLFGRVKLERHRVVCRDCEHYTQPQDMQLKALDGGHATRAFREMACLSGASWPYQSAASVMEKITGSPISHEQVRRLTNQEGRELAAEALLEASELLQGPASDIASEPEAVNIALDGG